MQTKPPSPTIPAHSPISVQSSAHWLTVFRAWSQHQSALSCQSLLQFKIASRNGSYSGHHFPTLLRPYHVVTVSPCPEFQCLFAVAFRIRKRLSARASSFDANASSICLACWYPVSLSHASKKACS